MLQVLLGAPNQHVLAVKCIVEDLFVLTEISYQCLGLPPVPHELIILRHLHLEQGVLLLVGLLEVCSMHIIFSYGHTFHESVELVNFIQVLLVTVMILQL